MYNFYRVGSAVPTIKLADTIYNAKQIVDLIKIGETLKVQILAFPELSLTGYSCQDLFKQMPLLENTEKSLNYILEETKDTKLIFILGMPVLYKNKIFNCSIVAKGGKILSIVKKSELTLNETRFFSNERNVDIEIIYCEQKTRLLEKPIFSDEKGFTFSLNFSNENIHLNTSNIVIYQSATPASTLKVSFLESEINIYTRNNNNCCVYVNAGFGESTTDFVYDGQSLISECGKTKSIGKNFSTESQIIYADIDVDLKPRNTCCNDFERCIINIEIPENNIKNLIPNININPFLPYSEEQRYNLACEEILSIQKLGLIKRSAHTNAKKLILGISGGLDSTLSLLVSVLSKDMLNEPREDIIGITMPGFGTTNKTHENAKKLMQLLKISSKEISIIPACEQHFDDIKQDINTFDVTFENSQARERTQILLDIANMENGLVVGTGDFTEIALGFATYNGDHMSNYSVNSNVPKTIVKALIKYICKLNIFSEEINNILTDITITHISPELLPPNEFGGMSQITEDLVGSYELNDFYLYYVLKHGYSPKKIIFMAESAFCGKYTKKELTTTLYNFYKRFITQQFKRSCSPDGPQVFDFSLSPRNGYLMPSDASFDVWIKEME